MKRLLPTLTLSTLLITATSAQAARRDAFYLPSDSFCAVYQGMIQREHKFTLWVDTNRELTIKANNDLKIAVILQGKILPAYHIRPESEATFSEHAYRTSNTGNHVIAVRGISNDATITFCLE